MNSKPDQKNNLLDAVISLNEAEELVTISENLFKTKLQILEKQLTNAKSEYEKYEIQKKANVLRADYEKSLQTIEDFAREVCSASGR